MKKKKSENNFNKKKNYKHKKLWHKSDRQIMGPFI